MHKKMPHHGTVMIPSFFRFHDILHTLTWMANGLKDADMTDEEQDPRILSPSLGICWMANPDSS